MEGSDNVGDMKGDTQQLQQEQPGEGSTSHILPGQTEREVQEEDVEEQAAGEQVQKEQETEEQVHQEQETEAVDIRRDTEVVREQVDEEQTDEREVVEQVDLEEEDRAEIYDRETVVEVLDQEEAEEQVDERNEDRDYLKEIEEIQEAFTFKGEVENQTNHEDIVENQINQKEAKEKYQNKETKEQVDQRQHTKERIPTYGRQSINDVKQKWEALEKQEDKSEVDNNKNYKIKGGQKPQDIESGLNSTGAMADTTKTSRFGGTSEKCAQCSRTVYAMEKMEVAGRLMHKTCFRCCKCNSPLSVGRFSVGGGDLYCLTHYKQAFREKGTYDVFTPDNPCKGKWQPKAQE